MEATIVGEILELKKRMEELLAKGEGVKKEE